MNIIKKDGTTESYNENKIIKACNKAAERAMVKLSESDFEKICFFVKEKTREYNSDDIDITLMHNIVESVLEEYYPAVAKSYKEYRNYKKDFIHMMDNVYAKSQSIRYIGDKSNANTDSALVSTKRSLIYNELSSELYKKFFLTHNEKQAMKDGYIYIHDRSARLDTINCCLSRVGTIMKGGFEMGNIWYSEPNSLDTAFDVMGDIILSTAAQQYGGYTIPQVDRILEPYAEKSFKIYRQEYIDICEKHNSCGEKILEKEADEYAYNKVKRDFEQGWQGLEYKLNTVGSSRGDYPFVTVTLGLQDTYLGSLASITLFNVHKNGQGKAGFKKPVLFPKIVFLYDETKHGNGVENTSRWGGEIFNAALDCSCKTMYPDWLSLTGEGYVPEMYKKYGEVVSPMGCRAFLSPWYERGGMTPEDEFDTPVFEGRFNLGVISLNLPMILAKARAESRDFYEVLYEYLELIRGLHKRTYEYIGELKASVNPVMFCEGGFYGGNLKPDDKIKSILKPMTISYGITALNELQELYNGKSIREDGQFALDVMQYIQDYIDKIKKEDDILYAVYATPAESLCFTGDTIVQTYSGNKQIKDITTDDLVYSFNEKEHKIELKKVVASKRTKQNAELVEVTFNTGQKIRCTPEHKFAVRIPNTDLKTGMFKGSECIKWIEAKCLNKGDRIKSNYITLNVHGRPQCSIYHRGKKQLIQDINAEYYLGEKPVGSVTHHKDRNKENNLFDNLEYLTDKEHRIEHLGETIKPFQYTSESQSGTNNSFYGKKHSEEAKLKNRKAHIGKSIEVFSLTMEHVSSYECIGDAERCEYTRHLIKKACEGHRNHLYKDFYWFYTEDCSDIVDKNHKVVSVEYLNYKEDVYDIEVEDNHNFFVGDSEGILVHNCGLQVEQFRKIYGIIENVSDRPYVSNSFHCHVTEDMTPVEKQDKEERFWNYFNGGKIQYCRYKLGYNKEAVKTLVLRAMKKGFYEGVNLAMSYCEDCGHQQVDMDVCPKCGSEHVSKIDRMNGYLGWTRVNGDTRYNESKNAEIADRVSM